MDFEPTSRAKAFHDKLFDFFNQEVLPLHRDWVRQVMRERREPDFLSALQAKARAEGLWNLALPDLTDDQPGTGLTNLEFAPLAEIMGRLPWGSQVFNCQAPDVPNMAMLQALATPDQKTQWLDPLLNAATRSAFAMTEPDVASSDASNIATKMAFEGDKVRINGRKWFATGGAHPDCSFLIVMGVSDPDAARTERQSMVIVPTTAPGVTISRTLNYLGWEDHVAPIAQIELDNVVVPAQNLVGERGRGFKGAQVRLGPARIHHAMRCIGMAEMLVELMIVRARERTAFGRSVIDYDTIQRWIGEARVEIDMNRLAVQRCAWLLDQEAARDSWRPVSMIKISVPNMLQKIADRALQIFGAMGGLDDLPIHHAFAYARWFRIGDGPDEVHLRQIFRSEPQPEWALKDSPYLSVPNLGEQKLRVAE
ncbi:acyl-CoA dehydrogenase family protein [Sulfitobacter sp. 20_GPM-1509m]|uniref:acyl-CoA dehydrogenase family protein n=1 Tax=Sulfitobacter sp. 20_GPM-1509m TaxID=1380367 RepID=UPI00048B8B02|nr:acyl-CoA dehydrogenase family protein [Sulfitobacter sp. 20_GPM-1509m]